MISPRATNNAYAGLHRKPGTKQTFQIHYKHAETKHIAEKAGWYWRTYPYDELTGEEAGPFTSSRAAFRDACSQS